MILLSMDSSDPVPLRPFEEKNSVNNLDWIYSSMPTPLATMESMKTLLFLAEKAALQGKVGAAFGAFGWSGEAPERIFNTMLNIYRMGSDDLLDDTNRRYHLPCISDTRPLGGASPH
jgi:hypothetical protein